MRFRGCGGLHTSFEGHVTNLLRRRLWLATIKHAGQRPGILQFGSDRPVQVARRRRPKSA